MLKGVLLTLVIVFLSQDTVLAAPDCGAILQHGLWNNRYFEQTATRAYRAKHWFCNTYRHQSSEISQTGLLVGIKGLNLDFSQSRDFKALTVKDACSDSAVSEDQADKVIDFWSTASGVIVDAWSTCIKQQSAYAGFKVWVENTADPAEFNVEFRNDRPSSDQVKISRVLVSGAKCESTVPLPFQGSGSAYTLGPQGATAVCERCPLRQVRISIAASELPNGARDAASVITIPPAPDRPLGSCVVALQLPKLVLKPSGRCVQGGDAPPRNCDAEGCTLPRCFTVSAVEGGELRERCFARCTRTQSGNGCGHVFEVTETKPDNRSIRVCYVYSSHAITYEHGYTEWAPVQEPALETRPPVQIFANVPIPISWPKNAIDVKLACRVGAADIVLDPRAFGKAGPVSVQKLSESPLEVLAQVSVEGKSPYADACKQ